MSDSLRMWFDPVCPWAWMTSRWLLEAEKVRDIDVTFSVMSLSVLNEGKDDLSDDYQNLMRMAWGPVRVIVAAARDHGEGVVRPLYDEMGTRIHLQRRRHELSAVIAESLEAVGLPSDLAHYADTDEVDDALRESHAEAIQRVGNDVGTPVVAVGEVAFFGPVVSPAPKGEAAGKLLDGCLLVASTPGFFELKRTRDVDPIFD